MPLPAESIVPSQRCQNVNTMDGTDEPPSSLPTLGLFAVTDGLPDAYDAIDTTSVASHAGQSGGLCEDAPPIRAVHQAPHTNRPVGEPGDSQLLDYETRQLLHQGHDVRSGLGPMSLSFLGKSLLDELPIGGRVCVRFSDVNSWVPLSFQSPSLVTSVSQSLSRQLSSVYSGKEPRQADRKQILCNVSGSVAPGEVLAIMGPSGSGKTSLISILGGRTPNAMDVEGDIHYNGKELNKAIKRRIGFVLQDDMMFESLTVEETLHYAALLRLPKTMSRMEKMKRVDKVISVLGLNKCRETLIGGFTMPGVSGGERKRVSVGHELLINPAVIILDEPTSGLDSTTAMYLLSTLRQLAQGGRAIMTTIHQPSSRLYLQMDSVLLLSDGQVMYNGAASLALDWFDHMGYLCPPGMNIADFMLDLASGVLDAQGRGSEKAMDGMMSGFASFARQHPKGLQSKSQLEVTATSSDALDLICSQGSSDMSLPSPRTANSETLAIETTKKEKWGAGWSDQCKVLFQRGMRTRRFDAFSAQKYIQLLAVAVISGLVWWQRGGDDTLLSASDVTGLLFFELIFISFTSQFAAVFTFPNDFKMMLKERASGMYRLSAYYVARSATELPMDCFIPSLFVIVLYWFTGLRPSASAFFFNWLTIVLTALVAQSYGMLIGAALMNVKTAQTVATVAMLTFMLVSGFYVRDVPEWMNWLKYLSFTYWGFNILLKVEFHDREYVDCGGLNDEPITTDCERIDDIGEALSLPPDVNAPAYPDALAMIGILVVVRVVIYYVLKKKTHV